MARKNIFKIDYQDYFYILLGAIVQSVSLHFFLIPSLLVSGGVSGLAQVINYFTEWPIGIMIFLGNLPLFVIGWRYLGGKRFAIRTLIAIIGVSLFTDGLTLIFSNECITNDLFLNSIYGGVIYGIGLGLVYRGKGTSGGSDIVGMILFHKFGLSLTQAYMITDALIVLAGGLAFSWELGLYGMIVIYISGLSAELISEGMGVLRTLMIITKNPHDVANRIMDVLGRGVTILEAQGAYSGESRQMLLCIVTRSQVNQVKSLVFQDDMEAFMIVGQAQEALGEGFKEYEKI